jgi:large subunit ribosomal protein L29
MSTLRELRDLSDDELRQREHELADELFRLRLRRAAAQLANAMKPRETRRTLARVKTLLRERRGARGGAA